MKIKKYEINEEAAKSAKMANSFSDYRENSATESYIGYITRFEDKVQDMIDHSKNKVTNEMLDAIEYLSDRYSSKLARALNEQYRIEASCPSIMICGAGNFPVRKKQKQNKARDNWWHKYEDLFNEDNYYMKKIDNILNNKVIYSNDDLAIEKLENKVADLEECQAKMKEVNAYYRKNKTLDGCELLTEIEIERLKENMARFSWEDKPFASYVLTNNNADIRRTKERIEEIKKLKERAAQKDESKYPQVDGLEVVEDAADMRIRILFDEIPNAETRDILKSNGFKWSPKNSAWQRQLTSNGIWATKQVLSTLKNKE